MLTFSRAVIRHAALFVDLADNGLFPLLLPLSQM